LHTSTGGLTVVIDGFTIDTSQNIKTGLFASFGNIIRLLMLLLLLLLTRHCFSLRLIEIALGWQVALFFRHETTSLRLDTS